MTVLLICLLKLQERIPNYHRWAIAKRREVQERINSYDSDKIERLNEASQDAFHNLKASNLRLEEKVNSLLQANSELTKRVDSCLAAMKTREQDIRAREDYLNRKLASLLDAAPANPPLRAQANARINPRTRTTNDQPMMGLRDASRPRQPSLPSKFGKSFVQNLQTWRSHNCEEFVQCGQSEWQSTTKSRFNKYHTAMLCIKKKQEDENFLTIDQAAKSLDDELQKSKMNMTDFLASKRTEHPQIVSRNKRKKATISDAGVKKRARRQGTGLPRRRESTPTTMPTNGMAYGNGGRSVQANAQLAIKRRGISGRIPFAVARQQELQKRGQIKTPSRLKPPPRYDVPSTRQQQIRNKVAASGAKQNANKAVGKKIRSLTNQQVLENAVEINELRTQLTTEKMAPVLRKRPGRNVPKDNIVGPCAIMGCKYSTVLRRDHHCYSPHCRNGIHHVCANEFGLGEMECYCCTDCQEHIPNSYYQ